MGAHNAALLALADEMVQVLAQTPAREMSRTHDVIGGWQRALRALAAQPAGAIAIHQVQWHEDNRTEWEDTSDPSSFDGPNWKHRTVFTAPPAASVDVEQFREACECMKLWYAGRWTPVCPEKRAVADRLLALIDSAGGTPIPPCVCHDHADAPCPEHSGAAPQPDAGGAQP